MTRADHHPILVIGHRGMLGCDFLARLQADGRRPIGLDVQEIDITRAAQVEAALGDCHPALVVNCAAYTAVDKAESEPDVAYAVNRTGPENLAVACSRHRLPLIHISTDYVFDGKAAQPYKEDDPAHPINVYGHSKWEGEKAVRANLPEHLIVRTAWLYGIHGNSFVRTIRRLANEREELRIVADQYGSPTWTGDLSDALARISADLLTGAVHGAWGTYHFTNSGQSSWYDFARLVVEHARRAGEVKVQRIVPIASTEYPVATPRPAYSVLDCSRITRKFGIVPRPWETAFAEMSSHHP